MTYMFQVTVKNKYVGNGIQLPVGLSVRVPYESMSSPLTTFAGKQAIANAFAMQCGLDLSRCPSCISSAYMIAERM